MTVDISQHTVDVQTWAAVTQQAETRHNCAVSFFFFPVRVAGL